MYIVYWPPKKMFQKATPLYKLLKKKSEYYLLTLLIYINDIYH